MGLYKLVLRVVKDLTKTAAPDSIHALSPSPKELVIGYFPFQT